MPISFKYRFIISFVVLETIFILMIVGINFFSLDDSTQQSIKDKKESSLSLIKELVKSPLIVYDIATLDDITHNIVDINNINSVFIFDERYQLLSSHNNLEDFISNQDLHTLKSNKSTTLTINDKTYEVIYDEVKYDETMLGYVFLILDFENFALLVQDNKRYTITLIVLEILLSSVVAFFIGMRLTNKLNFLTQATQDIGKNAKVEIPFTHDKSELGQLSNSINEMQNKIFQRNAKLVQFKYIFEKILEGVVILDHKTVITYVNPSFCNITGYTREEILGKRISILKSGKHEKSFYEKMWQDIKVKKYWNGKITNRRKNGEFYDERLSVSVIDGLEEEKLYVGIFSDITELLKYDQLMKEKEKIYHQQAKMASMGEMLGNIAHQWRQPLNMISLTASSIKMGIDTQLYEKKEYMDLSDQIISTTQYLSQTIDDFRHFFKQDKEKETINIKTTIDSTLQLVMPALKNKDITLHVDVKESIMIQTYANELKQVLVNIINNAKDVLVERAVEPKVIKIAVGVIEGMVEIEILDNAGGIEEEVIEKVFEPYFTTKHQSRGTGIGLYMSQEIVTKHLNGNISVFNKEFVCNEEKYKGASFIVKVPLS